MNKQYGIATPTGFKPVIDDILNLYKDSHRETLVVSLQGDLGAGKTAFTQELARSLGVVEVVTSPTFTIMKQYEIDNKDFDLMVHIDAYRIESEEEVEPLHLESVFNRTKTVVCIEWPERIRSIIPQHSVEILISIGENEVRQVSLSAD